jgi:NTE family protein
MNYISGEEENTPGSTSNSTIKQSFNHHFFLLKGNYDRYFRFSKHFTLGWMAEGVYSNKKPFSNYMATVLSAPVFNPTPHSKTVFMEDFRANKYVASGLKGLLILSDAFHIRAEAYAFAPVSEILETPERTAIYNDKNFTSIKFMGTGALVFQSAIGPISFSVNYYDKSQTKLFAMLNVGYILFNRKGY